MIERLQVLGQYLVEKTGKSFNFKQIKADQFFKGVLFVLGNDNYLVSDSEYELLEIANKMSTTKFSDYPERFAKKYTHMRFVKANEKKYEIFNLKGKKYYIIKL